MSIFMPLGGWHILRCAWLPTKQTVGQIYAEVVP